MTDDGKNRAPNPIARLLIVLAVFTGVTWFAVAPWSSFVRDATAPIAPRPETGAERASESPPPEEPVEGAPVSPGALAVRGRVVDDRGQGVAGALATVRIVERRAPRPLAELESAARALTERRGKAPLQLAERIDLWRELVWGRTVATLGRAASAADGRFEVLGREPQPEAVLALDVRLMPRGALEGLAHEIHFDQADARERVLSAGSVSLERVAPWTIFVTDTTGRTVEGALVELRLGGSPFLPLTAASGVDGICELRVPPGEHELSAGKSGFTSASSSVRSDGRPENVALELEAR
jgi:hypothetical protein